jgi:ribonuclease HI
MNKKIISIYTDGSCLNPGGSGGWAICIIENNIDFILSGYDVATTNNRMELTAIIEAITCIKKYESCKIYTDSQLCINCASGKWQRKANTDLWEKYNIVSKDKNITYEWVKGHSGNYYNEIVDKLAKAEAKQINI